MDSVPDHFFSFWPVIRSFFHDCKEQMAEGSEEKDTAANLLFVVKMRVTGALL